MEQRISQTEAAKLRELLEGIRTAMVTTVHDGQLRSRPMAVQQSQFDEGVMWFMTGLDTEKAHEVEEDSAVNVAFANEGDNRFVSISGRCRLVQDIPKQKELWTSFARAWFDGPEDSNLVLMRVEIDGAEYWDGPKSKMVMMVGWLKSKVTGGGIDMGDNATIEPRATLK